MNAPPTFESFLLHEEEKKLVHFTITKKKQTITIYNLKNCLIPNIKIESSKNWTQK